MSIPIHRPINFTITIGNIMKITIALMFGFFVVFWIPTVSFSQDSRWTVVTTAHDTLRLCSIGKLEEGMVIFTSADMKKQIHVDSLILLSRHRDGHFWKGAGYGSLAGTFLGGFVGVASYKKSSYDFGPGFSALGGAILGAVGGFTIGGILGATAGGDQIYELSTLSIEEKIKVLRELRNED